MKIFLNHQREKKAEDHMTAYRYHMFGRDVHLLKVQLQQTSSSNTTTVFQKQGDYGDNWNYGQVPLTVTEEMMVGCCCRWAGSTLVLSQLVVELIRCAQVVFEAVKKRGMRNDIALDDIRLTSGPCGPAPPDPTQVPPPPTTPPIPSTVTGSKNLMRKTTTV